ncbi:terminase small subunit [uncultured Kocuria sp.]|uniref:terminase small subunit n=1 Tax=uncultured Kocuria sp. TaxID=259305 RepID=UPI0026204106|nr:terminase small subunit [uncultured Kocuria sp.]
MARPTKLTKDLVEKANKYLSTCLGVLPTKEGLALYLGVHRSTVYEWKDLDTPLGREFSDIFEEIMAEQAVRLINGGLYNRFNSTITKLMLVKHDYVDKQETDHHIKEMPAPLLGGTTPLPVPAEKPKPSTKAE